MKLGLVTDSLAAYSLPEAAAICRRLGLEQVELGCGNWSPAPHTDLKTLTADGSARRRLLDTLGENGLTISALNCSGNPLFLVSKGITFCNFHGILSGNQIGHTVYNPGQDITGFC